MPVVPSKTAAFIEKIHALKVPVLIAMCLITVIFIGASGYRLWRDHTNMQKQRQAAALESARNLSSGGACETAVQSLQEALSWGLGDTQRAEATLLLGECQLQIRDFSAAQTTLQDAKTLLEQLNQPELASKADLLLTEAKLRQQTQEAQNQQPEDSIGDGTYDGVRTL